MNRVRVVDSHTEGEPTRVVLSGLPDLGAGSVAAKAARFAETGRDFRRGVLAEPRGSEVWVGALLMPPDDPASTAGVIFFNTVGNLGMCGHGLIGVVATLAHLGRLAPGAHRFDTPVGPVAAELRPDGRVTFENVRSYRHLTGVTVEVPEFGPVTGDVAWGGNWFFLGDYYPNRIRLADADALTRLAVRIRHALIEAGVTGAGGGEIDHIEFCSRPESPANSGRNFVLTPSLAYDRSPCGTGTSAKLACLAADGKLAPGENWLQEGIAGGVFAGRYRASPEGGIVPEVTGRAWVTAEAELLFAADDPFAAGLGE